MSKWSIVLCILEVLANELVQSPSENDKVYFTFSGVS